MSRSNERLAWFLVIAGVLHAGIFLIKVPLGTAWLPEVADDKSPIEVEALSDERKPVVQTSKAEEQLEKKEREARFSGQFDQRVREESQASRRGKFDPGTVGRPSPETPVGKEGDPGAAEPSMADLRAFGSSPNALPDDIKQGGQTLLNTDKVLYASFMDRIADDIYYPWVENVQNAAKDLANHGRKLEANNYVTKLKIVMNREGELVSIQILKSSGVLEIDEAPKKAFWDREPFRNPPVQMFDKDGFASFTYEFTLEWKTSTFNIVPWEI